MNEERISFALGDIGDDLILEAKKDHPYDHIGRHFAAVAACLVLLICVIYFISRSQSPNADQPILQATASTVQSNTGPTASPVVVPPVASTAAHIVPPTVPASTTASPSTQPEGAAIPHLLITTSEMFNQMFLAADNQDIFVQHQDLIVTFGNRDELSKFITKLRQLPMPNMEGMYCTHFGYIPRYETFPTGGRIYFILKDKTGNICSFIFELDEDRAKSIRDSMEAQDKLTVQEWDVPGAAVQTITAFEPISSEIDSCWMEIDGSLVLLNYKGTKSTIEALMLNLSLKNELLWE